MLVTIYGEGGFDETKPNNNVVEQFDLPDPEPTPEQLAKESAIQKLKDLGLTEEEIKALTRPL